MGNAFVKWYDFLMRPLEQGKLRAVRRELIGRATGNVLELASGTGVNFPLYQAVERVTAIEPNQDMIDRSMMKIQQSAVPIEIVKANAEQLPFEDNSFDTVVATLALCTIPNTEKVLSEIKRVCKPEGKILLLEHVRLKNPLLAKLQDWLTPFWRKICDGCSLNRDTLNVIKMRGFKVVDLKELYKGLFVIVELRK